MQTAQRLAAIIAGTCTMAAAVAYASAVMTPIALLAGVIAIAAGSMLLAWGVGQQQ